MLTYHVHICTDFIFINVTFMYANNAVFTRAQCSVHTCMQTVFIHTTCNVNTCTYIFTPSEILKLLQTCLVQSLRPEG